MSPVSDFLKKKLTFVFQTFFDVNKDGSIQKDDFDIAIKKICQVRGHTEGDEGYKNVSESFLKIWEGLRDQADADGDDEVSVDEWISLWTVADGGVKQQEWKDLYRDFMFKLFDADGDGSLDEAEFLVIMETFGVHKNESTLAFQKISEGGKITVDKGHYAKLWGEFFSSNDPNAMGNCIFGKTF